MRTLATTPSVGGVQPGEREDWIAVAGHLGRDPVLVVCLDSAPERDVRRQTADGRTVTMSVATGEPSDQQSAPFPIACLGACLVGAAPEVRRAAIHQAVQHLERDGMVALHPSIAHEFAHLCAEFRLEPAAPAPGGAVLYRRGDRTTVHDLLWAARASIRRVDPTALLSELATDPAPIVVDTRSDTDRSRAGVIAGSIHIPRTVLEWHLDAANGYRHPAVTDVDDPLVLVCNGGYSSSLAAANLVQVGFTNVRDLVGGMRAWLHAGLPVVAPDHAHLDL